MENFITHIPTQPVEWMILAATGIVAALWLFNRIRRQDMDVLRISNNDLRVALEDNAKKIENLTNTVTDLQNKVIALESKNQTLQDLVIVALEEYFNNNPEVAKTIQKKLK
jgi:uncharacterized protein YlxW (UPF0749 family)